MLAPVLEPPRYRPWGDLTGADKWREFHNLAVAADEHPPGLEPSGYHADSYVSAYREYDVVYLTMSKTQSIEHVVPQSYYPENHPAPNDPNGWIEAYVYANKRRGNLPLVLWDAENISTKFESRYYIDGEPHFVPPLAQRPRLARKWLYMRATYSGGRDSIIPPSHAQLEHKVNILNMVKNNPPSAVEIRMDKYLNGLARWSNPLISDHDFATKHFLNDVHWGNMVFPQRFGRAGDSPLVATFGE